MGPLASYFSSCRSVNSTAFSLFQHVDSCDDLLFLFQMHAKQIKTQFYSGASVKIFLFLAKCLGHSSLLLPLYICRVRHHLSFGMNYCSLQSWTAERNWACKSFSPHHCVFQYVLKLHYLKRLCNRLPPPRLLICERLSHRYSCGFFQMHS